jgi:hypothetical protein
MAHRDRRRNIGRRYRTEWGNGSREGALGDEGTERAVDLGITHETERADRDAARSIEVDDQGPGVARVRFSSRRAAGKQPHDG